MRRLYNWVRCRLGLHDWTCRAAEGIKPTDDQLSRGLEGFKDYAEMYCKSCKAARSIRLLGPEYFPDKPWRPF